MHEDSNPKNKEIWQNMSLGVVVVQKFDRRGEVTDELVPGGQKTSLTKDERLFNMDQAADAKLDNFSNGSLVPVRLIDDADAAEIASNPNLLTEDDLRKLVKIKKGFPAKVNEIGNYTTLNRLKQIAEEEDASVNQVRAIESRMKEVLPDAPAVERTQTALPSNSRAVTP